MLAAGEDPRFIARRILIFASEDVGNVDSDGVAWSPTRRMSDTVEMFGHAGRPHHAGPSGDVRCLRSKVERRVRRVGTRCKSSWKKATRREIPTTLEDSAATRRRSVTAKIIVTRMISRAIT